MQWKYLRDHHARQDKTKKPHYRDAMLELGRSTSDGITQEVLGASIALIKRRFLREVKQAKYFFCDCQYMMGWGIKEFASQNQIPTITDETKAVYKQIKQRAEKDFRDITEAVQQETPEGLMLLNRFAVAAKLESNWCITDGSCEKILP